MWSATRAEHAFVDNRRFELTAFDIPPEKPCEERIIGWEVLSGPKLLTQIASGETKTYEEAKAAAERTVTELIEKEAQKTVVTDDSYTRD